uniref:Uncharacterized protein n=1 Tax=Poecilia latipinna TaxID=48699 RepID=A0A3B3UR55_9TELE
VVQSSGPVHCNVRLLTVQLHRATPSLTSLHLLAELRHVVRPDGSEELDVVVTVVLGHLICSGLTTYIDLHLSVQPVVQKKVVGHPDAVRLHGMTLSVVIISYVTCKANRGSNYFHMLLSTLQLSLALMLIFSIRMLGSNRRAHFGRPRLNFFRNVLV